MGGAIVRKPFNALSLPRERNEWKLGSTGGPAGRASRLAREACTAATDYPTDCAVRTSRRREDLLA